MSTPDPQEDSLTNQPAPIIAAARPVELPKPTWVTGWDLVAGVAILWAVDIGLNVAAGALYALEANLFGSVLAAEVTPFLILVMTVFSSVATLTVTWYFVCKKYNLPFARGFVLKPIGLRGTLVCVVTGLAGAVAAAVVFARVETGESVMAQLASTPGGLTAITIIALLVPPVEELYYRGFLYPVLNRKIGGLASVLVVTGWFGLVHAYQLAGDWVALVVVVLMGAVWTIQRHISRSLVPSIVTHWTYNACLVLLPVILELSTR